MNCNALDHPVLKRLPLPDDIKRVIYKMIFDSMLRVKFDAINKEFHATWSWHDGFHYMRGRSNGNGDGYLRNKRFPFVTVNDMNKAWHSVCNFKGVRTSFLPKRYMK